MMNDSQAMIDATVNDYLWKSGGKIFYVYTHAKPDGVIFYVGKGVGNRAKDFSQRSDYHKRVASKYGQQNIIIKAYATFDERHAYAVERQLILAMRKAGHRLINMDDGGVGRLGVRISPEHREKLRIAGMGHPVSAETRIKISAAGKGRIASAETRLKLSQKKLSEAHIAALVASRKGKPMSEDHKAKIGAANKGRVFTEEQRKRMGRPKNQQLEIAAC
jgi:hypothetical protein